MTFTPTPEATLTLTPVHFLSSLPLHRQPSPPRRRSRLAESGLLLPRISAAEKLCRQRRRSPRLLRPLAAPGRRRGHQPPAPLARSQGCPRRRFLRLPPPGPGPLAPGPEGARFLPWRRGDRGFRGIFGHPGPDLALSPPRRRPFAAGSWAFTSGGGHREYPLHRSRRAPGPHSLEIESLRRERGPCQPWERGPALDPGPKKKGGLVPPDATPSDLRRWLRHFPSTLRDLPGGGRLVARRLRSPRRRRSLRRGSLELQRRPLTGLRPRRWTPRSAPEPGPRRLRR